MVNKDVIYERRRFYKKQESYEKTTVKKKKKNKQIKHMKKYKPRAKHLLHDQYIRRKELIKMS